MKIGTCMATFNTRFSAAPFKGTNTITNINQIAQLGYQGIDLFLHRISQVELNELIGQIEKAALDVTAAAAFWITENGITLSHEEPEKRKEALVLLNEHIAIAARLNTNIPLGPIRGNRIGDESHRSYEKRLAETLRRMIDKSEPLGVKLLIEPVNRYESNTLNRVEQCLDFIESYKLTQLRLLLDTFHMNIEEKQIEKAILLSSGYLTHMHVADSNRGAPGFGHLDYNSILKALISINYNGFLTIESQPFPSVEVSAQEGINFLRSLLNN